MGKERKKPPHFWHLVGYTLSFFFPFNHYSYAYPFFPHLFPPPFVVFFSSTHFFSVFCQSCFFPLSHIHTCPTTTTVFFFLFFGCWIIFIPGLLFPKPLQNIYLISIITKYIGKKDKNTMKTYQSHQSHFLDAQPFFFFESTVTTPVYISSGQQSFVWPTIILFYFFACSSYIYCTLTHTLFILFFCNTAL